MGKSITEWLKENSEEGNIFAPAMSGQKAVNFLKDYLLGEDWYSVNPLPTNQVNTEIVISILEKYSKKYKKEIRRTRWKI